ncbi:hypothetical protein J6590_044000 [Homalodisca vitripennis]|nr:hypothetical protein J6590_044000 [Homalodisca vitripennis]
MTGSVPAQYREVEAEINSLVSPEFSRKDVLRSFIKKSKLRDEKLDQIWELLQLADDHVSSDQLFAALALVGWAQQGRDLSLELFDNQASDSQADYMLLGRDQMLAHVLPVGLAPYEGHFAVQIGFLFQEDAPDEL